MPWFGEITGMHWVCALGVLTGCYALGCVTLGYYLVRLATGKDIRSVGSGSVGASNVGRTLGPWGFGATLAGDLGKGAVAVWVTERFAESEGMKLVAILAVVTGHVWPVQLRFHGGKGMATAAGALTAFNPLLMAGLFAAFGMACAGLRSVVLAGLAAFSLLPAVNGLLGESAASTAGLTVLTALVLFAHRENLKEEFAELAAKRRNRVRPGVSQE